VLVECRPGVLADLIGYRPLTLSGCVKVDESGPCAVVAHVFHQFAEARGRICGELVAGMAQVMKVNAGQADSDKSRKPHAPVEITVAHRSTVRASEDKRRSRTEPVKVLAEIGHDEIRKRHDAPTGTRLGRPERVAAAARVVDLAGNADSARIQIDVGGTERGEFSPAEASEGG
jgi:hypothetical protein